MNELAQGMLTAFELGDEQTVRLQAEQMLNLLAGSQSPDHKDWSGYFPHALTRTKPRGNSPVHMPNV